MYKNILLPCNGLAKCSSGTCHGVLLAKLHQATVTAVYVSKYFSVQEVLNYYHEDSPWSVSDGKKAQEAIREAHQMHEEPVDRAFHAVERMCADHGVPCKLMHLEGDSPADEVVHAAEQEGCDLIFLSTHGRPGIIKELLSLVAAKVIATTGIPVLVHQCGGPA